MLKAEPEFNEEQQVQNAKALRKGTFINHYLKMFSVIMNHGAKQVCELLDSSPFMAQPCGQCIQDDDYDTK